MRLAIWEDENEYGQKTIQGAEENRGYILRHEGGLGALSLHHQGLILES